jgi:SAM-dependent methyltransferase
MSPAAAASAAELDPIVEAIGRAGITGITAKQLSEVTRIPTEHVSDRLGELSTGETITRIGRGLWVLRRFAVVGKSESGFRGPASYDRQFERAFGLKIGVKEGEIQFNPNERRPVHRWWPYVQGFSAGFVAETCRRFGAGPGTVILDPFCGSGTVPVTARMLGAKGVGIDMMPIAAFVAGAKGEWDVDPTAILSIARKVTKDRSAPTIPKPFLKETDRQFQPEILLALLRLKENLWAAEDGPTKTLLKLAFASILIDSSNLKRAPCLGYTKKLGLSADTPFTLFLESSHRIADDLRTLQARRGSWGPKIDIRVGSSAQIQLPEGSVDLAVTSPPYVNGMDYVMNYKIDLAWMDYIDSYAPLAHLRASMVACDNIPRSTAADHRPSGAVRSDKWLESVSRSIDRNIRTKGSYRRDDMGAIVTKYFDDLVPVMQNVFYALKPGGRFVVVNGDSLIAGTYVPGDMIFARLAAEIGFIVESFELARTRRSGQRRGFMLRESIATLRKPGPYAPPRAIRAGQTLDDFGPPN